VIEMISIALEVNTKSINTFLQRPMRLVSGALYCARQSPGLPMERESFFDAVRSDRTMKEKQQAYWLSFEKRKKQ
jgi:hypothetical protein